MRSVLFALVVCSLTIGASAQSANDANVKSRIAALEQLWNQAYKAGDVKALDSILDDSVVLVNDDGSVQTKVEFLDSVKAPSQPVAQQQQVSPESLTVYVKGNVAIATGVMRVKGVEHGKAYSRQERFVDTWLNKGGNNWVCIATDATPVLH